MNIWGAQSGALTRPNPTVPVPSMSTATTVPQAFMRSRLNCVAPTKLAANAGRRYEVPADGEPELSDEASIAPAKPAIADEVIREKKRSRSTRTDASLAASGLNPLA